MDQGACTVELSVCYEACVYREGTQEGWPELLIVRDAKIPYKGESGIVGFGDGGEVCLFL